MRGSSCVMRIPLASLPVSVPLASTHPPTLRSLGLGSPLARTCAARRPGASPAREPCSSINCVANLLPSPCLATYVVPGRPHATPGWPKDGSNHSYPGPLAGAILPDISPGSGTSMSFRRNDFPALAPHQPTVRIGSRNPSCSMGVSLSPPSRAETRWHQNIEASAPASLRAGAGRGR